MADGSKIIPFPGDIGGVFCLSAGKAVQNPPSDQPPFREGDLCEMGPSPSFRFKFRVIRVDGDDVYFERVS